MQALLLGLTLALFGPHDVQYPIAPEHFRLAGVRLGVDTVDAAARRLGVAKPPRARELCLRGEDGAVLLIRSEDGRTVTEVELWQQPVPQGEDARCVPARGVHARIGTGGGVALGMSGDEISERVRSPLGRCRRDLLHFFAPESRDVANVLDVALEHGRAVAITVRRIAGGGTMSWAPEPGHPQCDAG